MMSRSSLLVRTATPLYWLMLVAAGWILLRGHNAPGGGFIAGLVAVAASSLLAVNRDSRHARRLQPASPLALCMLGVLLALLSGLAGLSMGLPYLSHLWSSSGLSTVMLFDLGVFCAVWGALSGYIYALIEAGEEPA